MLSRSGIIARRTFTRAAFHPRPAVLVNSYKPSVRFFSNNDELKETLKKLKEDTEAKQKATEAEKTGETPQESAETEVKQQPSGPSAFSSGLDMVKSGFSFLVENVKLAYEELKGEDTKKSSYIKRKIEVYDAKPSKPTEEGGEDAEPRDAGPSAIVLVKEQKSPWEQMRDRLQDSPLIREMLKRGKRVSQVAGATDLGKKVQNAGQSVRDRMEDVREMWETTQNPIVYTISGAWETVAGETEESIALQAIRRLDDQFDKEEFLAEVRDNLVPRIIKAHLGGDFKVLRDWCGEGVYNKLAADIRTRKNDKLEFNDSILNVDEMEAVFKVNDQDNVPYVIVGYQVQQINCIKKAGEIIEVCSFSSFFSFFSSVPCVKGGVSRDDYNKFIFERTDH